MIRKAFKTCAAGLAAGLGLLAGAVPAMGQTPPTTGTPGDWPNLGAFNNRQGRNANPYAYNSGDTNLRYFTPSTVQERNSLTLDNTDLRLNGFTRGGPYDDPQTTAFGILPANPPVLPVDPTGLVAPLSFVTPSSKAAWPTPATLDDEAEAANVPVVRASNIDAARPYNYSIRTTQYFPETRTAANPSAAYSYSYGVPSDPAGDGTQPIAGQTAAYFEYKFVPPAGDERTFALFAHLPVGTTNVPNPVNTSVNVRLYPQRYFVYEIRFGPDNDGNGIPDYRIVDILDTETAGNGFVRLGVQGNEGNTFFPYSGTNSSIRVRLYNTVPRDTMVPSLQSSTGKLLLTNAPAVGSTTAEVALSKGHLVYADSAMVTPYTGTFGASPTTSTLSGNTANGAITGNTPDAGNQDVAANWNVTGARTAFAYNFAYSSSDVSTIFNQDNVDQGRTIRGTLVPGTDGVVSNYQANPALWPATAQTTPYEKWRYSLAQTSSSTTTQDRETAGTTYNGFALSTSVGSPNLNPNHLGADYLTAPATTGATSATVTYKPDLADGQYDIYAYIPGDYTSGAASERYITGMTYYIFEGANIVYVGTINESLPQGWLRLGTRRYANTQTELPQEALSVVFTNKNASTTDAAERIVYADAVKFVGRSNSGFTSTPVHATVGILQTDKTTVVDTRVVLVADENGKIHCLDEEGRADGTTTEYWSYPSTTPSTAPTIPFMDPNLSELGYDPLNKVYRGIDGSYNPTLGELNQPTAKMPSGFDLSTAAVARVYPNPANLTIYNDLLYVGSTNGRVYCLNMGGRGDFNVARRDPGTTTRRWTFPDDYDPSSPSAPSGTATLGVFRGSVVFGDPVVGGNATPTVYVAARQGRVYALNALGDQATTHTTTRWQFPTVAQNTTLPRISMTPTLFSPTTGGINRLMFGTLADDTNEGPGQFYCLDARTGTPVWQYNGIVTTVPNNPDTRVSGTGLDSFVAGPVVVNSGTLAQRRSSLTLASGAVPVLYDTVYALNQNGYLFGLNVADGTLVSDDLPASTKGSGTHVYFTNTLDALSAQNLTFTFASDNVRNAALNDALQTVPMIVISGDNGVLSQMFARPEDYNAYTDTTVDATYPTAEYDYRSVNGAFSDTTNALTSSAASNNFLFVNDTRGSLYALDGSGITSNIPVGVDTGYRRGISPNDPRGDSFRHLKVRLLNRTGYNTLRQTTNATLNTGPLTYAQTMTATDPINPVTDHGGPLNKNYLTASSATGDVANPYAFEWGETAYVLVYNFPYIDHRLDSNGQELTGDANHVDPPEVTVNFSVEGRVLRSPTVFAKKFAGTGAPTVGTLEASGYAVASFAFNNSGTSALPPGTGRITTTIATAALSASGSAKVNIPQPRRGGATIYFVTANPLAITMADPTTGVPNNSFTIGGGTNLTNGSYLENIVNGTPNTADKALESQLHAATPVANHGTSVTARVVVYDRSLIALLHEDGLSNFRVTRSNLMRQGGSRAIFYPLRSTEYPGFEDTPSTDFTNTSLDYPDIGREQVRVALGANGATQNPVSVASTLLPPTIVINNVEQPVTIDNYDKGTRLPRATPMDLTVDVPRYQPPVDTRLEPDTATFGMSELTSTDGARDLTHLRHDSSGARILNQGYFGRIQAFIDSDNNQRLTSDTSKETFRSFNMSTAVLPQFSVLTGTPSVDLGSLASGTGYSPVDPHSAYLTNKFLSLFSPWFGDLAPQDDPRSTSRWSDVYKPISVRNDGNVNLSNLRLAKAFTNSADPTTALPWTLPTADNDPLAWMTATLRGGNVLLPNDNQLAPGDLWSNIDSTFSATNRFTGGRNVILAKPRVTDRVPTELVANPYPRANPNIAITAGGTVVPKGTAGSVLVNGSKDNRLDKSSVTSGSNTYVIPSSTPRVGVSVPLGFPVGNYSAQVRVVENLIPFPNPVDNDILQTPSNISEVYSDPITITYKVRETRLTNRSTPQTAFMLDNPNGFPDIPTNWPKINSAGDPYAGKLSYRNTDPTAMRDAGGGITVAWTSDDRAKIDLTNQATAALKIYPSRIFFGRVGTTGEAKPAGNPPLWDLSKFAGATNTQWFKSNNVAFPADSQVNTLFGTGTPDTDTVSFGSPSFPQRGPLNPLTAPGQELSSSFGTVAMGFVGDAQVRTQTGRLSQSKVFLTNVSTDANGNVATTTPINLGGDPQTKKGKPSMAQLSNGTLAFFTETGAGQSSITVSRVNGGRVTTTPLGFGDGFSSVFSPSASPRLYQGSDPALSNSVGAAKGTGAIIDLSFAGKLRGRANAELYLGRLRLNPADASLVDSNRQNIETSGAGSPFAALPTQTYERATAEGNGVYRTRGVDWTSTNGIAVVQVLPGQAATDLLITATRAVDRQSGLIAYDSRLGGKAYVDPQLGTIRFTGAVPNRNSEVRVTYTPFFLRVDPGGTGALNVSSVNGLWDDRFALDYTTDNNGNLVPTAPEYWFAGNGAVINQVRTATAQSGVRNDRYFFAYSRGAAGGGMTARPYMTSMRIGIRLPTRVATDVDGKVIGIQVSGNKHPYQVDPANGRVYFMAEDEDNLNVAIAYTGVNEATNGLVNLTIPAGQIRPSFVLERTESPLAVDEATNDTAISAFLDPLTNATEPRPALYWLFYVSTRAGGPDLYFQSIAPRYTPFSK